MNNFTFPKSTKLFLIINIYTIFYIIIVFYRCYYIIAPYRIQKDLDKILSLFILRIELRLLY